MPTLKPSSDMVDDAPCQLLLVQRHIDPHSLGRRAPAAGRARTPRSRTGEMPKSYQNDQKT
jgi:hypothetical protein